MGVRSGAAFLKEARRFLALRELPAPRFLARLLDTARGVLESEAPQLRPRDGLGRPGGYLQLPELPLVLLPDLHARPDFLLKALEWVPPLETALRKRGEPAGRPLIELLGAGRALLVLLGDLFHSEGLGARERWVRAHAEYRSGWAPSGVMDEEMRKALSGLGLVLGLKIAFPDFVHCLKGNHDNVTNENAHGDHPFYKFAEEGAMAASWFAARYGAELRAAYREIELSLPLLARGSRFVASHAEPAFPLGPEELREYRSRPEVVEALIWTPNDGAQPGAVEASLKAFLGSAAAGARWLSGHRPVTGRYALRAEGRLIQFHALDREALAFLLPDREPDPDRDIRWI